MRLIVGDYLNFVPQYRMLPAFRFVRRTPA